MEEPSNYYIYVIATKPCKTKSPNSINHYLDFDEVCGPNKVYENKNKNEIWASGPLRVRGFIKFCNT